MRLQQFIAGASSPLRGAAFIMRHGSLWPLCIAPLVINGLLLFIVWHFLGQWFSDILARHFSTGSWWQNIVHYLAAALFMLMRLVAMLVAFVTAGNMLCIPFNDLLSEQTDRLASGWRSDRAFNLAEFLREICVLAVQEIKRVMIYVPVMVLLFIASLSVLLAPFTMPAKVGVSSVFFSTEYFAYPLERRGVLLLNDKFAFTRSHLDSALGFGMVMTCIGLIPLVNFLFIPLGVVSGTLLFVELTSRTGYSEVPASAIGKST
jgi:uncharacterized protein involved in cysteine biosynthesis